MPSGWMDKVEYGELEYGMAMGLLARRLHAMRLSGSLRGAWGWSRGVCTDIVAGKCSYVLHLRIPGRLQVLDVRICSRWLK